MQTLIDFKRIKIFILLIFQFVLACSAIASEISIPIEDVKAFEQQLADPSKSCIVSNSFRSGFYTDIYVCGETEDLKKYPADTNYRYATFVFTWYFEKGRTIEDAKIEKKLLSAGLTLHADGTKEIENYIVDENSIYLWGVIDRYTCFHLGDDMGITKRQCYK